MKSQDFRWMSHRGFEDINGDIWEIVYMDESSKPK
jgi:predicted lactoylglutathione lyase